MITYKKPKDFKLALIYEHIGYFYDPQLDKYAAIFEINGTALKKFGNNPEEFKKMLEKFHPTNLRKKIKDWMNDKPSSSLDTNMSYIATCYMKCLAAIVQIDLECPGFIEQFPEAKEFIFMQQRGTLHYIISKFNNLLEKVLCSFNRYSKKCDYNYVKNLFEIDTEKLKEENIRIDDYISKKFSILWKTGNEEERHYLLKNYTYRDTLLPNDYYSILEIMDYMTMNTSINSSIDKMDMKWIDIYSERLDEITELIQNEDIIKEIRPSIMKKINSTLIL